MPTCLGEKPLSVYFALAKRHKPNPAVCGLSLNPVNHRDFVAAHCLHQKLLIRAAMSGRGGLEVIRRQRRTDPDAVAIPTALPNFSNQIPN
jgi:hypothetical protein